MPAAAYITIQFPSFQTWAAQKVVESIEDKIDGKIEVEKVAISFLNKVIVKKESCRRKMIFGSFFSFLVFIIC